MPFGPASSKQPADGDHFDVVVLGGGSAGETVCEELAGSGMMVALVEASRVGGICPFLACMPSKSLLRSAGVRTLVKLAHRYGASARALEPGDAWSAYRLAVRRRDEVADRRDDREHAEELGSAGARIVRGQGTVTRHGSLGVRLTGRGSIELGFEQLVVATGSEPKDPPLDGLHGGGLTVWTSDEALASNELPRRLVVLGAGAVGCELALAFRRFGSDVTVVEPAPQPLEGEEPEVAGALAEALRAEGIELLLGVSPAAVADGALVLEDGRRVGADRLLLAAGRAPRSGGLGLERLGVELGEHGEVPVDDRCAVTGADGVFACGDVTGKVPFTHGAKHQARVVAANLRGGDERVALDSVPRVVFTDPPVASVGLSRAAAEQARLSVESAVTDVGETARAEADGLLLEPDEEGPGPNGDGRAAAAPPAAPRAGVLVLVVDRARGVLVGASACAPSADEWIGEAALAVAAEIPLSTLAAVVHPFPTFSEAYEPALRQLAAELSRGAAVS